ncbi:MAG: TspO/MBR family protein [Crocosphaera sp.]
MSQSKPTTNRLENVVNSVMGVQDPSPAKDSNINTQQFDGKAVLIYLGGTVMQIAAMVLALSAMQWGVKQLMVDNVPSWLPTAIATLFFIVVTLRSRLFSPLDNTRSRGRYQQVTRPNWSPPPFAFAIIWMTIGVLRIISSVLVWQAVGENFLSLPLIAFVIHLALGDTWNTIFTVEGRLGLAVPVVILGPMLSAIVVTVLYWQTFVLAGLLLAPSVVWLAIACVLVYSIWQLNGSEPWYPLKREKAGQTA